jgi:CO/xanthine dehydrogenase Mo-binding subunit
MPPRELEPPLPRWTAEGPMKVVGRPAPRASAQAKLVGNAVFASDAWLPEMVHAAFVRSPIARGTVTGFDATQALALDGVLAAFGPLDAPVHDPWPTLRRRRRAVIGTAVGFVGEEIGVVVATNESIARHAVRKIRVTIEPLPPCITIEQALADDAPQLSPSGNVPGGEELIERGDLAAAEAEAEVVVEARYSTSAQHHQCLEAHGCVALWQGEDLTLWDSNQGPHLIRESLAQTLGLPIEHVNVISTFVGGGFGSKIHLRPHQVVAAILARRLGRPVRLFMGRREEFIAAQQRAPTTRSIRLGATRQGRLCFVDHQVTGQGGPDPAALYSAAGAANGLRLHRAKAVRATLRRVLTNTPSPTPFRGPAAAEDIFCLEQAVDELALALALDPLELRLRNVADIDFLEGLPYTGKALERCYRLGAAAFGWRHRPARSRIEGRRARGIGMGALFYDATLYEASEATLALRADGRFELMLGISDIGTGADTVLAQIAAEELGVAADRVVTRFGDARMTPRSIDASNHSRTTAVVGPAVRAAAAKLRDAMRGPASGDLSCTAAREPGPTGVVAAMFGAHFVEVEVDLLTGCVAVLRAVCAHDAGRVINPRLAESQVHGAFLQGMGMALHEERVLDPRTGVMLNAMQWAYRAPGVGDVPTSIAFVDASRPDGGNSLGVKGLGEPPLIASGAAIANAVHNAIGCRLRHYPITPDKVLAAWKEAAT